MHDGLLWYTTTWVLIQSSEFGLPCGNTCHHTDTGVPRIIQYYIDFLLYFQYRHKLNMAVRTFWYFISRKILYIKLWLNRYDHLDSSERMKTTNGFLIPEVTVRQPLLEVSQNAGYSKEPSINGELFPCKFYMGFYSLFFRS